MSIPQRTFAPDTTAPAATASRTWSRLACAVASAAQILGLASCGQAPGIRLVLTTGTVELVRGAEVQIEVTLVRSGGAGADVTLTIAGLPADVTAGFAPATLSGDTLSSTLTFSAPALSAENVHTLTVVGTGGGLTATAALSLEVQSLTVTGRILSTYDLPVGGVSVGSQGSSDVTDASGSFTLTGLSVPYDLSAWDSADQWLNVYQGLRNAAPDLPLVLTSVAPTLVNRSAAVTGTLSGAAIPVPANQTVAVCLEGLDSVTLGCDTLTTGESSYSIAAEWWGPASTEVRIHALQVERTAGNELTSYPGYARSTLTLTDTVPTVADLDLGSALPITMVEVDVDAAVAIAATLAAVELGPSLTVGLTVINSPASIHEFTMPVIADASYTFASANNLSHFGWQAGMTGPSVDVELTAAPQPEVPADGANDVVSSTVFTVTNPTGGPLVYIWTASGGPGVAVVTTATSLAIPDLTPYGMSIAPATTVDWQVAAHSGPGTAEASQIGRDVTGFVQMVFGGVSQGLNGSGWVAISESWQFTTAP